MSSETTLKAELEFHAVGRIPSQDGDYLLYNQCDGYHLAQAWFIDGEFCGFHNWGGTEITPNCYEAFALLPESHSVLFDVFAKKPSNT